MGPFTLEDENGEAQGLAIDLLRLWSERTGIPIEFRSAIWDETVQAMRNGTGDIHPSLYFTEERDEFLEYTTVIASSAGVVFHDRNIVSVSGLDALRGYRVGVV